MSTEIEIGDIVRSYDFPDTLGLKNEFYVVGEVIDIMEYEGCLRYVIRADRRVWNGYPTLQGVTGPFYVPVNGTKTTLGGVCHGVEKVSDTELLAESLMITCGKCSLKMPTDQAHYHSGLQVWLGDNCCWDERLVSTK